MCSHGCPCEHRYLQLEGGYLICQHGRKLRQNGVEYDHYSPYKKRHQHSFSKLQKQSLNCPLGIIPRPFNFPCSFEFYAAVGGVSKYTRLANVSVIWQGDSRLFFKLRFLFFFNLRTSLFQYRVQGTEHCNLKPKTENSSDTRP